MRKITMYRYDEQLENSTNPYDNWNSRSVPLQLLPTKLYTGKKIKTTNHQLVVFVAMAKRVLHTCWWWGPVLSLKLNT